jgi:hypothetical protein
VKEIDALVPQRSEVPSCEVQSPLASLPGILRTTLETVPAAIPYLHANSELVEEWKSSEREVRSVKCEVRSANGRPASTPHSALRTRDFLAGIAWQGNPGYGYDRQRSIPLKEFAPLAEIESVKLVSLQKGPGTEQLPERCEVRSADQAFALRTSHFALYNPELDEASGPFMDTAAIMINLDLVICSDSAVAHLAGALGVPVWLALPFVPDWRWMLQRNDSPWYPTMRLFRQASFGKWEDVFRGIATELKQVVRTKLER